MARREWSAEKVATGTLQGELYAPESDAGESRTDGTGGHGRDRDGERRPALVIMPSSAGVCDIRERFYAKAFAKQGCLCLIVDAFSRRGLAQCMTDQTLLDDRDMLEDARAAYRWLATREDVGRIGILGVSKGGLAALNAAMTSIPGLPPAPGAFAVHICIAPSCAVQLRHPRTTGAPILMLLGGRDDYTGAAPALRYAERMARIGGSAVETVVFPEAHHAWELCGEPQYYQQAECYADCLFYEEGDGSITDAATGESMSAEQFRRQRRRFARYGAHAGGGTGALRRRTCETILSFLRKTGFLAERD